MIKFHVTLGRFFFDNKELFELALKSNEDLKEEDFRDATEEEAIEYVKDVEAAASEPRMIPTRGKVNAAKRFARKQVVHCDMMGNCKLSDEWKKYYQEMHGLLSLEKLPPLHRWPKKPEVLG